ncbi:Cytochrome c-type bioproteinsis CcmH-like mitochondrial protein [Hibiscus syriacus]|uniref:Cytochrome c-type biogenesis protein n=1 Tax=Hibiscus syriacus TaxID=106335 RepID=A0A6A2XKL2_HIBSY|nr:Cytochrome c-type bioproteinsis CcmH-like mitochondrial protein [Hibiscus syriacus]
MGGGPVPGLLLSEMFPSRIRAKAMSICMAIRWESFYNWILSKSTTELGGHVTLQGAAEYQMIYFENGKQVVEARARNISHNVRCTECGSQSIEDSQADIAILLRKLIRDEILAGKSDKEIYKKLEEDYGETVLYAQKFDLQQLCGYHRFWGQLLVAGAAAGVWAYKKHRQKTNVHIMALDLVRDVPLTPKEK